MPPTGTRFDWYQATFDRLDDGRVPAGLALALGGSVVRGKARNGYAAAWDVLVGGDVLASVYGHSAREGEVHVQASGSGCDPVVPVLRRLWPTHRLSRVDSSLDFRADFSQLDLVAVDFAAQRSLRHRLVTDSEGGATRYIGAPSSEVRVRIYKKSEQLRQAFPEQADTVPDGVVRAEVQVRPGKRDVKAAAARLAPDDVWGMAQWTSDLAGSLLGFQPARLTTHYRRVSDHARILAVLGLQYGPAFGRRVDEVGRAIAVEEFVAALEGEPQLC